MIKLNEVKPTECLLDHEMKPIIARGAAGTKKTIIIASFVIGIIAVGCLCAPLMVSESAQTMAGVEMLSQDMAAAKEHLDLAIANDPHSAVCLPAKGHVLRPAQAS